MWSIETTDTFDVWFDTLDDIDRTNYYKRKGLCYQYPM